MSGVEGKVAVGVLGYRVVGGHLPTSPRADPAQESQLSPFEYFVSSSWKTFVEEGDWSSWLK